MKATSEAGAWLRQAALALTGLSEQPALDARVLLEAVLGITRARLAAHPEQIITADQLHTLDQLLGRRVPGEPLPYLIGKWEFFGLEFFVTPAVLIPRPETELLVERALAWLKSHPGRRLAADIGAGSGCIAVSLAKNCPGLNVLAGDLSRAALQVARRNILHHQLAGQVLPYQGDLLQPTALQLDLLCANLPYIPAVKAAGLKVARFEPFVALAGGPDGLDLVRRLLEQSTTRMAGGSLILLEIEAGQGPQALAAGRAWYPDARCQVLPDLAGLDRVLEINLEKDSR